MPNDELRYCEEDWCQSLFANDCEDPVACLQRIRGVHIFMLPANSEVAFYITTLSQTVH